MKLTNWEVFEVLNKRVKDFQLCLSGVCTTPSEDSKTKLKASIANLREALKDVDTILEGKETK